MRPNPIQCTKFPENPDPIQSIPCPTLLLISTKSGRKMSLKMAEKNRSGDNADGMIIAWCDNSFIHFRHCGTGAAATEKNLVGRQQNKHMSEFIQIKNKYMNKSYNRQYTIINKLIETRFSIQLPLPPPHTIYFAQNSGHKQTK